MLENEYASSSTGSELSEISLAVVLDSRESTGSEGETEGSKKYYTQNPKSIEFSARGFCIPSFFRDLLILLKEVL